MKRHALKQQAARRKLWIDAFSLREPVSTSLENALASDEPELRTFAFGQFPHRLSDDDVLEVRRLLVIGESCFACEYLVEEVFVAARPGLVDLEFLHAGFALCLRKEFPQKVCDRGFLARIDLPERGDDEDLVGLSVAAMLFSCAIFSAG